MDAVPFAGDNIRSADPLSDTSNLVFEGRFVYARFGFYSRWAAEDSGLVARVST